MVAGYGNGSQGSALNALMGPLGLARDRNGSIYVADYLNSRVMKYQQGSLLGTIVAGTGAPGNSLTEMNRPIDVHVDALNNIYITDSNNNRVMLWRENSSIGHLVAGTGDSGAALNRFSVPAGVTVDSQGNIYVSDFSNHRVMKWFPNATNGIIVAGTGTPGNGSDQLQMPCGVYLDEFHWFLYVADSGNHRIQRYSLNGSNTVTTVAGGNGPGTGDEQLNTPYGICVSKKTQSIYVADLYNHRIQLWSPGGTRGSTIAGTAGLSGMSSTLLNEPSDVILNDEETLLLVSELANSRVQAFHLI